jgi:phosphatidylserine/phosphatidylglycerophosphate/cardiolipin synthase-like enzyme
MSVAVTAYTSPTLVLLAFDWPDGDSRNDFLGFAIERTPGFNSTVKSWLPNRISWDGPIEGQPDIPSNQAPIQKFYWWDARINTADRGSTFHYRVIPVTGPWNSLHLQDAEAGEIDARINTIEENGITTHFNRAVVSSQSFSKEFPDISTPAKIKAARAWLANGMEESVPDFLQRAAGKDIEGAIYHLTDQLWILPSLESYGGSVSLAYNHTSGDDASDAAIASLVAAGQPAANFKQRTHANIMHNKFLVRVGAAGKAEALLAGSANFTSEGLSAQANVLHAFESPALAELYLTRKRMLDGNPALAKTQKAQTGWSAPISVGDATIQAYFPPEPTTTRMSLDEIVNAIKAAEHSVLLCAYDPTDKDLLDAAVAAADAGKMVLGLVNRVPSTLPTGDLTHADVAAKIELFNWYEKDHAVVGFDAFKKGDTPTDFYPERVLWPGEDPKIMVRIHHKFVVIDAEGDNPVVFTGSANFSGNSLHHNDENQLKITNCPRIAKMYMAEFLRLYEHYRARMQYERRKAGNTEVFKLTKDKSWNKKYLTKGTSDEKARVAMAGA